VDARSASLSQKPTGQLPHVRILHELLEFVEQHDDARQMGYGRFALRGDETIAALKFGVNPTQGVGGLSNVAGDGPDHPRQVAENAQARAVLAIQSHQGRLSCLMRELGRRVAQRHRLTRPCRAPHEEMRNVVAKPQDDGRAALVQTRDPATVPHRVMGDVAVANLGLGEGVGPGSFDPDQFAAHEHRRIAGKIPGDELPGDGGVVAGEQAQHFGGRHSHLQQDDPGPRPGDAAGLAGNGFAGQTLGQSAHQRFAGLFQEQPARVVGSGLQLHRYLLALWLYVWKSEQHRPRPGFTDGAGLRRQGEPGFRADLDENDLQTGMVRQALDGRNMLPQHHTPPPVRRQARHQHQVQRLARYGFRGSPAGDELVLKPLERRVVGSRRLNRKRQRDHHYWP